MGIFRLKRVTFSEEEKDNTKEKKSHPVLSSTAGGLVGFIGGAIADDKINRPDLELEFHNSKVNAITDEKWKNLKNLDWENRKKEFDKFIKGKEFKEEKDKLWREFLKNRSKEARMVVIPTTLIGAGVGYAISRRNKNKEKN